MKASRFVSSIALWTILISVLMGCAAPTATPTAVIALPTATPQPEIQETPVATEPPAATEVISPEATEMPPVPSANDTLTWVADGVITDGEYTDSANFGKIRLWWRHDGEYLYFAMEGDTQGWVSVGIEPTRAMKDADYFFGFVVNGEAKLWDAFGMGTTGPTHPADEEIGGANDILEFAGVETDGLTRFELKRLLDTGDIYDKALVPGNSYNIIIAIGDDDDFDGYHSLVRSGKMVLQP